MSSLIRDAHGPPVSHLVRDQLKELAGELARVRLATALTLRSVLAPVTSWDAGVAHLALPSDYARADRIAFLEGNVYSAYPHLMHSLFAYVFSESGETPVALTSWLFGVLACLSVYCLGRRADGRETGFIGAAIFSTSPLFFSQAGPVLVDVASAALPAAAFNFSTS